MNLKQPFSKLSFTLTVIGMILIIIGLPITIAANKNSTLLHNWINLLNLKNNISYISVSILLTLVLMAIFSVGITLTFLWIKNDNKYYKWAALLSLFIGCIIILVLTISSITKNTLPYIAPTYEPSFIIPFLGYIPFFIGIFWESYEEYQAFFKNKENQNLIIKLENTNEKYSQLNQEIIINQEQQKLNEIEQLKQKIEKLKNQLEVVSKTPDEPFVDENLETKTYNNSNYYQDQNEKQDLNTNNLINDKTIEEINLQTVNSDDESFLLNQDLFNDDELVFNIPNIIDEEDIAEQELQKPYISTND